MFNRDRNVSVMERVRPEYRSGGIQSGAFVYSPVLNTQLELNDNIFATGSNEQSDGILVFSPYAISLWFWDGNLFLLSWGGLTRGIRHRRFGSI